MHVYLYANFCSSTNNRLLCVCVCVCVSVCAYVFSPGIEQMRNVFTGRLNDWFQQYVTFNNNNNSNSVMPAKAIHVHVMYKYRIEHDPIRSNFLVPDKSGTMYRSTRRSSEEGHEINQFFKTQSIRGKTENSESSYA